MRLEKADWRNLFDMTGQVVANGLCDEAETLLAASEIRPANVPQLLADAKTEVDRYTFGDHRTRFSPRVQAALAVLFQAIGVHLDHCLRDAMTRLAVSVRAGIAGEDDWSCYEARRLVQDRAQVEIRKLLEQIPRYTYAIATLYKMAHGQHAY